MAMRTVEEKADRLQNLKATDDFVQHGVDRLALKGASGEREDGVA
jgi:hypothetical protein